jgi:DNA-binding MarR family transcriptional regulator
LRHPATLQDTTSAPPDIPKLSGYARIGALLQRAARLTGKAARLRMESMQAWPGQIPILLWLAKSDGLIQRELVARVGMEQSTVAEHIDRMERDGLVVRRQNEGDRRAFHIHLTDEARGVAKQLTNQTRSEARLFTRGVPPDDLQIFTQVLETIIANLDAYLQDTAPAPVVTRKPGTTARATSGKIAKANTQLSKKPRKTKSAAR